MMYLPLQAPWRWLRLCSVRRKGVKGKLEMKDEFKVLVEEVKQFGEQVGSLKGQEMDGRAGVLVLW